MLNKDFNRFQTFNSQLITDLKLNTNISDQSTFRVPEHEQFQNFWCQKSEETFFEETFWLPTDVRCRAKVLCRSQICLRAPLPFSSTIC